MSNRSWRTVAIKDLYEGLFDGPHATPKPSDQGPVFLGIKNVTDDGGLDLSDVRHIAEEDFSRWTRRVQPQPGDLVFTYEATLNRYAIIPEGFRGCLGRRMALIRVDPQRVDVRYLFYYFFAPEWRSVIASKMIAGSTVDRIPLVHFPDFPVRIPSLAQQKQIADILSAYDELIKNNQRRIQILESMARALYREWFVNFRFPGHEKVRRVPSEFGETPEGWVVKKMPECVAIDPKVTISRDGVKPFVPMGCLSNDSMIISEIESRTGNSGSKFQNRDTLLARITPCLENGKTGFVQFLPDSTSVAFGSTEFIVLRSKSVTPEYVYCLARSEELRGIAIKSMSGASGRQRVREQCFDDLLVAQPPRSVLERFTEVVSPSFGLIHQLHLQIVNLSKTRDLLLPRLLSGQIEIEAKWA